MGMPHEIAYNQNATKPVQITAGHATYQTLHDDLKVPFIKDAIHPTEKYKLSQQIRKP
jgi:hypothetical protein